MKSERRPSGKNGEMQTWHFCPECWREMQEQRSDKDPWIAARYLVFLQWFSGYRVRYFYGSLASRILPEKKMVDKGEYVHTMNSHEAYQPESKRRTPQKIQDGLCPGGNGNERQDPQMDRSLLERSGEEAEEVNCNAAEPGTVSAIPDS